MARPRSALAHRKVLESAAELFATQGIEATSMDAIARASTVSKATIYKHWPDKDSLCLEVLLYVYGLDQERPVFNTGSLRDDLIAQLQYDPSSDRHEIKEKIWPHLIAYSGKNQEFGNAWRARLMEPIRKSLVSLIRRGEKLGQLKPGIDAETALALLLGPAIYVKVFLQRVGIKSPEHLDALAVDAFLSAFETNKQSVQKSPDSPARATRKLASSPRE